MIRDRLVTCQLRCAPVAYRRNCRGRVHSQRYNVAVAASIEEFSYELTPDALREQERQSQRCGTRAGTVLAAASVSGSFLGTKVSQGSLDVWAVLALIAFVLCVGAAIYGLLPHSLVFAFRGQALLAVSDREGIDDVTEAYRAAGIWIDPMLESNRNRIGDFSDWFSISCASDGRSHPLDGQPGGLS
jgi:hypothetical protein